MVSLNPIVALWTSLCLCNMTFRFEEVFVIRKISSSLKFLEKYKELMLEEQYKFKLVVIPALLWALYVPLQPSDFMSTDTLNSNDLHIIKVNVILSWLSHKRFRGLFFITLDLHSELWRSKISQTGALFEKKKNMTRTQNYLHDAIECNSMWYLKHWK